MNKLEAVGKWHESQSVATMRIDTLSKTLAPLTVVKIDVEGAEAEALETISNYRATMLVEGPRELKDSMRALF
jgi:FkbM family methyltransferase